MVKPQSKALGAWVKRQRGRGKVRERREEGKERDKASNREDHIVRHMSRGQEMEQRTVK